MARMACRIKIVFKNTLILVFEGGIRTTTSTYNFYCTTLPFLAPRAYIVVLMTLEQHSSTLNFEATISQMCVNNGFVPLGKFCAGKVDLFLPLLLPFFC